VHVAQLFHALLLGKNDEVVKAALPNVSHGDGCTPKRVCLDTALAKFAQHPMGKGLLQGGHHQRRISPLRLGKQKMDMLRHNHVTGNHKSMVLADLLHNFEEEIARAGCPEKGTALIATGGNKVRVPSAVAPAQVYRHENDVTEIWRFICDE